MDRTAAFFAERYTRPDGTLRWRETWGGMDGTDNGYEVFIPYPLHYLTGGGDHVLQLAQKEWDAITWQFADYGTVDREFVAYFDWFHHSESYPYLFNLALADPAHHVNRRRALRFAAMYTGEDPSAPNWDAERRLIRSPINGSRGPRHRMTAGDWVNHRPVLAGYLVPWEDFPGLKGGDPFEKVDWNDDEVFALILKLMNERLARGDVPLNLHATTLITHAYLFTGEEKYRRWVLDYLSAWRERTERNGGVMPDNVGMSDRIGEYLDGKWWGGYYGWRWPHGSKNILEPTLVAGHNAAMLTGDDSWLDLHRSQLEVVWSHREEEDGQVLLPARHGDAGWFDYKPLDPQHFHVHHHIQQHYLSQKGSDLEWLDAAFPEREGFQHLRPEWPAFKGGPCPPNGWFAFIEGRDPAYPERVLQESRAGVYAALDRIEADDAHPDDIFCNYYHRLIPVVPNGVLQLMMGTPGPVYNGGLLHAHLFYFDPSRGRAGVPDSVAALVDTVSADGASVTLVNTDPAQGRTVLVQAGAFGEHRFTRAQQDGGEPVDVNGRWLEVRLGPSASTRLSLGMRRHAHRPAYGFPPFV